MLHLTQILTVSHTGNQSSIWLETLHRVSGEMKQNNSLTDVMTELVYINSSIIVVIILALCSIHCSRDKIGWFCSYIRMSINKPVDYNEAPTIELVELDPDERVKPLKGISSVNAEHTEPLVQLLIKTISPSFLCLV